MSRKHACFSLFMRHFSSGRETSPQKTALLFRKINRLDVENFSKISGDLNPIHIDETFAKTSVHKQCVVHGALINSIVTGLIANRLTGPGTVYLGQTVKFPHPLYLEETLLALVTLFPLQKQSPILRCRLFCACVSENSTEEEYQILRVVLEGEASLLVPRQNYRQLRQQMSDDSAF
eukprot:Sdes_comp21183_c0_seq1m19847